MTTNTDTTKAMRAGNPFITSAKHVKLPRGWSLSGRMDAVNIGIWSPERRKYISRKVSGYTLTDETGYERFLEGTVQSILPQLVLILSNHGYEV